MSTITSEGDQELAATYLQGEKEWNLAYELMEKSYTQRSDFRKLLSIQMSSDSLGLIFDSNRFLKQEKEDIWNTLKHFSYQRDTNQLAWLLNNLDTQLIEVDQKNELYMMGLDIGLDRLAAIFAEDSLSALFQHLSTLINERDYRYDHISYQAAINLSAFILAKGGEKDSLASYLNFLINYPRNQILNQDFKGAEQSLRFLTEIAPENTYVLSKLPPVLLFQGKVDEATALYMEWKDIPWQEDDRYTSLKEVFLADFEDFKNRVIIPAELIGEVEKIEELLIKDLQ